MVVVRGVAGDELDAEGEGGYSPRLDLLESISLLSLPINAREWRRLSLPRVLPGGGKATASSRSNSRAVVEEPLMEDCLSMDGVLLVVSVEDVVTGDLNWRSRMSDFDDEGVVGGELRG